MKYEYSMLVKTDLWNMNNTTYYSRPYEKSALWSMNWNMKKTRYREIWIGSGSKDGLMKYDYILELWLVNEILIPHGCKYGLITYRFYMEVNTALWNINMTGSNDGSMKYEYH